VHARPQAASHASAAAAVIHRVPVAVGLHVCVVVGVSAVGQGPAEPHDQLHQHPARAHVHTHAHSVVWSGRPCNEQHVASRRQHPVCAHMHAQKEMQSYSSCHEQRMASRRQHPVRARAWLDSAAGHASWCAPTTMHGVN